MSERNGMSFHYGNFSIITWEFLLIAYKIFINELDYNFTSIYLAFHKIMFYYIDFCKNLAFLTFKLHNYILLIFSLDPVKPQFYHISIGLKLRVRLGTCKTGLSPPVTLCY